MLLLPVTFLTFVNLEVASERCVVLLHHVLSSGWMVSVFLGLILSFLFLFCLIFWGGWRVVSLAKTFKRMNERT